MTTISMAEFRDEIESILKRVQEGQQFVITYHDMPAARLEPMEAASTVSVRTPPSFGTPDINDPFYGLVECADDSGASITNSEIDKIVYGI